MHIHQHQKNYKVTVLLVCMNVRYFHAYVLFQLSSKST